MSRLDDRLAEIAAQKSGVPVKKNVLLVIPIFSHVYQDPFYNFLAMMLNAGGALADRYHFGIFPRKRMSLPSAMNSAGDYLLQHNFDVMIAADDDCLPPYDAIPRLLAHYEQGHHYVSGLGYMRGYPYTRTVGRYLPEGHSIVRAPTGELEWRGWEWIDEVEDEPDLIPCDFSGMPISMISRTVFEKADRPWFGLTLDGGVCSHDVHFAYYVCKAGFQPYVDKTIDCGHLGDQAIVTGQNRVFARKIMHAAQDHEREKVGLPPMARYSGVPK